MSRPTQVPDQETSVTPKGLSPAAAALSSTFSFHLSPTNSGPTTPNVLAHLGFGLFPGRSPLLGESFLFSLPAGTKMFQFPAFASPKG